jgi:hypothetical protein
VLTNEGKWYVVGGLVIVVLLLVIWLWAILVWIGLGLALVALAIIGWHVWGIIQHQRIEHRKAVAAAVKAEAEAEQAQAEASERRARAALKHAEVEAARARVHLIPEGYVGAQLADPAETSLYHVWTFRQDRSPSLVHVAPETIVEELPPPALPGPTDLSHLLGTFRPSPAQILLALTAQGLVTCSLEGISHVALAAPTGGGKTNLLRLLLGQTLACGVVAYLADPHYTPVDPKSGEDWRMIAARLAQPPYTDAHVIKEVVVALVAEMRRRYALREQGKRWGAPCYLAIDEWPAILSELDKQAGTEIVISTGKLLRQGRKVDIHLITSSQDFLVETIGGSGEIRSNLRTAYFAGGGLATARALLDPQMKLPDTPLGKGVVLLRSEEALPTPTLVRVPYASNEALYRLLPIEQDEERYWAAFPPLPARQGNPGEAGEALSPVVERDSLDSSSAAPPLLQSEATKQERLGEWERKFIAQRYRAGEERTVIRDQLRELRGGFSNKLWGELKAICDGIDTEREGKA